MAANRRPTMTAADRFRADHLRRSKPPGSDPTGEHFASCRQIAEASGRDVDDVLELWAERSSLRQWDGGQSLTDAERDAVEDVRRIFVKQVTLL